MKIKKNKKRMKKSKRNLLRPGTHPDYKKHKIILTLVEQKIRQLETKFIAQRTNYKSKKCSTRETHPRYKNGIKF